MVLIMKDKCVPAYHEGGFPQIMSGIFYVSSNIFRATRVKHMGHFIVVDVLKDPPYVCLGNPINKMTNVAI